MSKLAYLDLDKIIDGLSPTAMQHMSYPGGGFTLLGKWIDLYQQDLALSECISQNLLVKNRTTATRTSFVYTAQGALVRDRLISGEYKIGRPCHTQALEENPLFGQWG